MHQAMPPCGWRTRDLPARGQAGYTLIEVIIAVALTGLVIIALATAMLTIVRTNSLNSDRQRVDAAMTSFSESVRGGGYLPCSGGSEPTPTDYRDAYLAAASEDTSGVWRPPSGVEVDVTAVQFWDPDVDGYGDGCPVADAGAQRLTLTTSWRDLERSAQIVIRR